MFETIRQSKSVMVFLLGLLVVAFVFVGVSGYTQLDSEGPVVAELEGVTITQAQWDRAHDFEIERLRQAMPQLDVKLLGSPEARYATLERLVQDELIAAAVREDRVVAGEAAVQNALRNDDWLNARRDASGNLNVEQVREELALRGMTDEAYAAQLAYGLSVAQISGGIEGTGFGLPVAAKATLDAYFERRQIQYARFNPRDFTKEATVTDDEVKAFYTDNQANFMAPETVDVAYLVLDQAEVAKSIEVSDADLLAYYEQNKSRLSGAEERRASHILLNLEKDAAPDAVKALEDKANALLAKVKADPASFAAVAKENSQDPGSAPQGGDLGLFGRGAMVPAFNDAVFAMKKGEISDIVRTDFGLHIIQVTDIKEPPIKPFAELKAQLLADQQSAQAMKKYAEIAETFSNSVYEQADSLEPTAEALGLQVRVAKGVSRAGPADKDDEPVWSNSKLREAVFSADAIEKKLNTAAVDIGESRLVAARVTAHQLARVRTLDEVGVRIRGLLVAQKAVALAAAKGKEALEAWRGGSQDAVDNVALSKLVTVSRDTQVDVPANLIIAALRVDAQKLPAWTSVDQGLQGFVVLKVAGVEKRASVAEAQAKQEIEQYARAWTSSELKAYVNLLKARFNATILVPNPSEAVAIAG